MDILVGTKLSAITQSMNLLKANGVTKRTFSVLLGIRKKVLTMDEYIEREALLADIDAAMENEGMGYVVGQTLKRYVKRAPAADVAPVRHARWVDNHCTACGMMPMGDEMWKHLDLEPPLFERFMDYCPSCGCRMDG